MTTSNTVTISKLKLKDKSIYVKIKWTVSQHEIFHITLYDGDTCWNGSFSKESEREYCMKVHESIEEYSNNVRISLAGDDDKFSYDLSIVEDVSNSAIFRWKKRFDDVLLVHGAVSVLREDIPAAKDTLIDSLIAENNNFKMTITEHSMQINELNSDLEKYKNELENAVSLKTSLETSLLSKFEQLLNAKKRRIQLLEDSLMKLERTS